MGCFGFMCAQSGKQVCHNDAVRAFLIVDGRVKEYMRGHYDHYGRVYKNKDDEESFEWAMDWNDVCDLIFAEDPTQGLAFVLESEWNETTPIMKSPNDPDQGCGEGDRANVQINNPTHLRNPAFLDPEPAAIAAVLREALAAQVKKANSLEFKAGQHDINRKMHVEMWTAQALTIHNQKEKINKLKYPRRQCRKMRRRA